MKNISVLLLPIYFLKYKHKCKVPTFCTLSLKCMTENLETFTN